MRAIASSFTLSIMDLSSTWHDVTDDVTDISHTEEVGKAYGIINIALESSILLSEMAKDGELRIKFDRVNDSYSYTEYYLINAINSQGENIYQVTGRTASAALGDDYKEDLDIEVDETDIGLIIESIATSYGVTADASDLYNLFI